MRQRRGLDAAHLLCNGPGKLCQAMGVTRALDGRTLEEPPFAFAARLGPVDVITGPRIGISKAVDAPWRFGLRGSRFLSRRFVG